MMRRHVCRIVTVIHDLIAEAELVAIWNRVLLHLQFPTREEKDEGVQECWCCR